MASTDALELVSVTCSMTTVETLKYLTVLLVVEEEAFLGALLYI